jgi:hypothetical protein
MLVEQIITMAVGNGLFAALFVFLFLYQLKDSTKREQKYQATIKSLSKSLEVVSDINENVINIKNLVIFEKKKGKKVNEV